MPATWSPAPQTTGACFSLQRSSETNQPLSSATFCYRRQMNDSSSEHHCPHVCALFRSHTNTTLDPVWRAFDVGMPCQYHAVVSTFAIQGAKCWESFACNKYKQAKDQCQETGLKVLEVQSKVHSIFARILADKHTATVGWCKERRYSAKVDELTRASCKNKLATASEYDTEASTSAAELCQLERPQPKLSNENGHPTHCRIAPFASTLIFRPATICFSSLRQKSWIKY
ncbi:uncharacterized protein MEPE_05289 [Melanopsichium pennsylvanicum]|uniref:Uncharacterized protein n=1 Tax=Melanopsichium pennsylvanicum TaxID=63383 RepID=A0AAJ5C762_9BASI|nr:uncharacterized protein MEPE_05289 [Melanopsichium pennsylvanicum]